MTDNLEIDQDMLTEILEHLMKLDLSEPRSLDQIANSCIAYFRGDNEVAEIHGRRAQGILVYLTIRYAESIYSELPFDLKNSAVKVLFTPPYKGILEFFRDQELESKTPKESLAQINIDEVEETTSCDYNSDNSKNEKKNIAKEGFGEEIDKQVKELEKYQQTDTGETTSLNHISNNNQQPVYALNTQENSQKQPSTNLYQPSISIEGQQNEQPGPSHIRY